MSYYLSFDSFAYLSNDEYGLDNHEKIMTKQIGKVKVKVLEPHRVFGTAGEWRSPILSFRRL